MAELGIILAKGTAELLEIIANDGCIPAAARFSLDILARQYAANAGGRTSSAIMR